MFKLIKAIQIKATVRFHLTVEWQKLMSQIVLSDRKQDFSDFNLNHLKIFEKCIF